jgi:DNA (cytosine-5)-methyltransferase 1
MPTTSSPTQDKTFCEFFAGIGLVRAGLEPSGWSCIYANDIDAKKRELYQARFPEENHFHLEDVWQTDRVLSRIPGRPFLATASFPCLDFSLAGHYKGFRGKHSNTFFGFSKVLEGLGRKRPKLVLLENVEGFLTASGGKDFKTAALYLAGLGYHLDAFVLDACHFTPQSRPRVFVVGMAADALPAATAPRESRLRNERIVAFMRSLHLPTGWVQLPLPEPPARTLSLSNVIDRDDEQEWWPAEEVLRHREMMPERHRRKVAELLSAGACWVGTAFRRIREQQQRAEVRFDGLAGCLRTPTGGSASQIVVMTAGGRLQMRWMSPREYARLQGADGFPLEGSKTGLLRAFADGVCVPAIAWIDRYILTPLYDAYQTTTTPPAGGKA